jgi:hypothetical protein
MAKKWFTAAFFGAVTGGALGFFLAIIVYCLILYPGSNTCGLMGFFYGLPIGLVIGGIVGTLAFFTRSKSS